MSQFFAFFSTASKASRRASRSALFALVVACLLVAGCGDEDDGVAYEMGAPIEDSTLAAIAEAESISDSLSAEQFEQGINPPQRGRRAGLPDSVQEQRQRALLRQLVQRTALLAAANERGLTIDSAQVSEALDQMASQQIMQQMRQLQMRMSRDSTLRLRLQQQGLTLDSLRQRMQSQVRQRMSVPAMREAMRKQRLVDAMVDTLQQEVERETGAPSKQEIQERSTEEARQVRLDQIVFRVPRGASEADRDSVRQYAQAVLDSARGAASFATLSERYDQASPVGGSSSYQTKRQLAGPLAARGQEPDDVPLVETAFALRDSGDVAEELVRTPFGFHLLQKTGERAGEPDTAAARQALTQERQREAWRDRLDELTEEVTLRVNPTYVTVDMSEPIEDDD